jgi:hypothetical protein
LLRQKKGGADLFFQFPMFFPVIQGKGPFFLQHRHHELYYFTLVLAADFQNFITGMIWQCGIFVAFEMWKSAVFEGVNH